MNDQPLHTMHPTSAIKIRPPIHEAAQPCAAPALCQSAQGFFLPLPDHVQADPAALPALPEGQPFIESKAQRLRLFRGQALQGVVQGGTEL